MQSVLGKLRDGLTGLLLDPRLGKVKKERLTYLSRAKLVRLQQALNDVGIQKIEGDHLEFGVAMGGSAVLIAAAAQKRGQNFAGFDVFGMIPPPTSDKDDNASKERYSVIASGASLGLGDDVYYGYRSNLYQDVVDVFVKNGLIVDGRTIKLVKGLFEETWPHHVSQRIAFCHIDCDWYDPVRYCLNAVRPLLAKGAVVILDDYHDYSGCRAATDEFLKEHPLFDVDDGPNLILRLRA